MIDGSAPEISVSSHNELASIASPSLLERDPTFEGKVKPFRIDFANQQLTENSQAERIKTIMAGVNVMKAWGIASQEKAQGFPQELPSTEEEQQTVNDTAKTIDLDIDLITKISDTLVTNTIDEGFYAALGTLLLRCDPDYKPLPDLERERQRVILQAKNYIASPFAFTTQQILPVSNEKELEFLYAQLPTIAHDLKQPQTTLRASIQLMQRHATAERYPTRRNRVVEKTQEFNEKIEGRIATLSERFKDCPMRIQDIENEIFINYLTKIFTNEKLSLNNCKFLYDENLEKETAIILPPVWVAQLFEGLISNTEKKYASIFKRAEHEPEMAKLAQNLEEKIMIVAQQSPHKDGIVFRFQDNGYGFPASMTGFGNLEPKKDSSDSLGSTDVTVRKTGYGHDDIPTSGFGLQQYAKEARERGMSLYAENREDGADVVLFIPFERKLSADQAAA